MTFYEELLQIAVTTPFLHPLTLVFLPSQTRLLLNYSPLHITLHLHLMRSRPSPYDGGLGRRVKSEGLKVNAVRATPEEILNQRSLYSQD